MPKRATVRSIAKVAGVSASTAFRALNNHTLVKPATLEKVLDAQRLLEAGESQPVSSPAGLAGIPSAPGSTIGIVMPVATAQDIGRHPSMFVIITSFLAALSTAGVTNTMLVFDENTMRGEDLLTQPMDGYLIIGTSEEQESMILPVLSKAAVPCVLVNRRADAPHVGCVNIDDMAACANATRYLIGLGHTDIAFLGGHSNYQNTKRRMQGYRQAMEEAKLPTVSDFILCGTYSETSGYTLGKRLLSLSRRPTAALCASDPIAIGCMRALEEENLRIPEDFSIVGFGDIEASRCVSPALTTIVQPGVDVGQMAAKVLLQMMCTPMIVNQTLMLQTKMVVRESTAPPRQE